MALSPLMTQYQQFKAENPNCIIMIRIGDFYEVFFEDAKLVAQELDLVLTGKDCGLEERAPMCGVPHHALDGYLERLVEKGYRVAIVDQLEDPAQAKGLVKRGITRIVTPGTLVKEGAERVNRYIAAIHQGLGGYGLVFADVATGDLFATELLGENTKERVITELATYRPVELVLSEEFDKEFLERITHAFFAPENLQDASVFDRQRALDCYRRHFGSLPTEDDLQGDVFRPDAVVPDESSFAVTAVGALLDTLDRLQRIDFPWVEALKKPLFYRAEQTLGMDHFSRRNLELTETMRNRARKGSLLWALDRTRTAAGARLLRQWLDKPLLNLNEIRSRQVAVQALYDDSVLRGQLRELLRGTADIERLCTKLARGSASARDLKALERTLAVLPALLDKIALYRLSDRIYAVASRCKELPELREAIEQTVCEDPPLSVKEGGLIKAGCNSAVDELRSMMQDGRSFLSKIESDEREKTGIKTLKVGYNRVFGYYIEVSNSFLSQVPESYIRRQTLTNGERFVTPELKEMEARVLGAKDRDCKLEYELFCSLRAYVLESLPQLQDTAAALAELDVFCSLAEVAREQQYVCPIVDHSDEIRIRSGRHPVVEQMQSGSFVPNDCTMDCKTNRLLLITGPNMAGKSTYMRQVALIVLMAQIGSFVPAEEARIGMVDHIFTRIGASDDLASGSSTFLLEMNEVASILRNATPHSLVIYDEIGRGTSTYDGMSIAQAVAEYTCKNIGAKALFATHYHELTALEGVLAGTVNYHIAAKKQGKDLLFLRKILRGAADDSYGIEVAHLAGVPDTVVNRAKKVLADLLANASGPQKAEKKIQDGDEISFTDLSEKQIADKLRGTDLDLLTPYEAMMLLYDLKKML